MTVERARVSDCCGRAPTREGFVPNPREVLDDGLIPLNAFHDFWVEIYPESGGCDSYKFQVHTCEPTGDGGIAFTGLEVWDKYLGPDPEDEFDDMPGIWGHVLTDVRVSGTYWPEKKLLSIVIQREQPE